MSNASFARCTFIAPAPLSHAAPAPVSHAALTLRHTTQLWTSSTYGPADRHAWHRFGTDVAEKGRGLGSNPFGQFQQRKCSQTVERIFDICALIEFKTVEAACGALHRPHIFFSRNQLCLVNDAQVA